MHKGPLTPTSVRFVESTPTHPLETGLKVVVELTAYPDGKFRIDVSRIDGPPNRRSLHILDTFMLNDTDEAKGHVDAIIDFVARRSLAGAATTDQ
jgi:hypothetical protein